LKNVVPWVTGNGITIAFFESTLEGVLNHNFRPFSFELNKKKFFIKMNFDLGFRVL